MAQGDTALIRFLQQFYGYTLTGSTKEQAILFVFGPGGNGKSVLQETVVALMGDYAVTAPMETFLASRHDLLTLVATVRATTGNAIPFECSQYRATGVRSADGTAGQHVRDAHSRTTTMRTP